MVSCLITWDAHTSLQQLTREGWWCYFHNNVYETEILGHLAVSPANESLTTLLCFPPLPRCNLDFYSSPNNNMSTLSIIILGGGVCVLALKATKSLEHHYQVHVGKVRVFFAPNVNLVPSLRLLPHYQNVAYRWSLFECWISGSWCKVAHFCICVFFFSVEYDSLGCFNDGTPRALPELLESFRKNIDWMNMAKIVQACAEVAYERGLQTFGLQFYGECWSGVNGSNTYDMYGPSKQCWSGVGKEGSYYVYKLKV